MSEQTETLTLTEAAAEAGVFWRTVAKWVHDGRLEATGERSDSQVARCEWEEFKARCNR